MAVKTKLILTFSTINDVSLEENISINMNTGAVSFSALETYKTLRTSNNQVTLATTGTLANENAKNFAQAINLDGTLFGLNAVRVDNVVTLSLDNESYYFEGATGTLIDNSKVSLSDETAPEVIEKTVTLNSYTANVSTPCVDINAILDVTGGNNIYNVYIDDVLTLSNQTTPITVPLKRGEINSLRVVDTTGATIGTITVTNPRKLISSDISTSVQNLVSGSNINISVTYISPYVSPYTYSLDGITYQVSGTYTGLPPDTYTIYVKDNLGCVTSTSIVVDGVTTITDTIFRISDINALRFAEYPIGKKNYKNTLSCDELRLISYPYYQKFLENDVITTQFKTNAQYINIFTIDENGTTNSLSPLKRTNNTGLVAKSTSTYFDLGDGRSAIYFGVVDLLDPITDNVIGNADYGFTLPVWANKAGNYVNIEGIGEVEIDAIGYSDTYEAFILEFAIAYNGSPVEKKISATYNLQPYEVYEFVTTMSNEPNEFNVVIETGKSANEIDFTYISEGIKIVEDYKTLFEIDYYMIDNENVGDMVYQTGIKHKLRLDGYVTYLGEQLTEGYDGDKEFYVTDNKVYHTEKFSFLRLSSEMAHKLRLVFAHTFLKINGIQYKIASVPEVPESEFSNYKNFFVTLKSGGNLLLTDQQEEILGTSEGLEIEAGFTAVQGKSLLLWTKTNG